MTHYAQAVSRGERATIPQPAAPDLRHLADALENMRVQLEGKAYVERYVETLTHELKSPLAAIRGAAELLHGEMSADDRSRFLRNIETQTERLQDLSERLLGLAIVEQQQSPVAVENINLDGLVSELVSAVQPRLIAAGITCDLNVPSGSSVRGERFLLRQAIQNLPDNAIRWTSHSGTINATAENRSGECLIRISNTGPQIPDYALPRLTERFYALPDPVTGRKSTGLGLNFVLEVAGLHHGHFTIENSGDGVIAALRLPLDSHTKATEAAPDPHR